MPSGKTHDVITFFLIAPTFAATQLVTKELPTSIIITFGMLFSGLMFGPDLDIHSRQYVRWGVVKFLWYPYQTVFPHRSRWSHGLIFGTLFRVIYFIGVLTLFSFLLTYIYAIYSGGDLPNLLKMTKTWQNIGDFVRLKLGDNAMPSMLLGLWLGAASHTLTDMAGTFIKTGRSGEFL